VYQITAFIGAGGMGDVYRARDTKLERDVAIKVLPASFAADPGRLARFHREAKLLAALNHPNVAAIYGVEESEGINALVLEFVEGSTLADRLSEGALRLEEAIPIASQIVAALETAHERGVIHRDLKPGNIKITTAGMVKVLDFGLAKAVSADGSAPDSTRSPTVTIGGTHVGVILGTAAYMSPEQARGQVIDKRTDIWAFGCVLYEMLTGRAAYARQTISDTLVAVLEGEPPLEGLPPDTPFLVQRLIRRCLEKDPRRRLHDIADARIDLDDTLAGPATSGPQAGSQQQRTGYKWVVPFIAALAIVTTAGFGLARLLNGTDRPTTTSRSGRSVGRFTELLPANTRLAPAPALAISQDGRTIAYVVEHSGARSLYVRHLNQAQARLLPGTDGAEQPFFSPDSRWIGFFAEAKLRKAPVDGGAPLTLADAPNPRGGSWAPDESIIFAPSASSPLLRVSATGGRSRPITTLDRGLNEASHRWPHVLADGETLLFAGGPTVTARLWNEAHVIAQSLRTNQRRVIAPHGTFPRFLSSGYVVYVQDRVVYAQALDPARLETAGDAVPVLEDVTQFGGINGGSYEVALSATGTLAYIPGGTAIPTSMVWVDRRGAEEPLAFAPCFCGWPRLSPDGLRVALTVAGTDGSEIWIYDISRGTTLRLTTGERSLWPVWVGDKDIAYASSQEGSTNVFLKPADRSGSEVRLTSSPDIAAPASSTPDGTTLLVNEFTTARSPSLLVLSFEREREPKLFYQADWIGFGSGPLSLSLRKGWLTYVSDESGRNEVYVRPLKPDKPAIQISTSGGNEPMWAPSGRELLFRRGDALMAADLTGGTDTLAVGPPREILRGSYLVGGVRAGYDIAPDGKRFLFVKSTGAAQIDATRLTIVTNWGDEVSERFSTR
jgi:serine/threonine protein kinase/Tol biopolymer transport system component